MINLDVFSLSLSAGSFRKKHRLISFTVSCFKNVVLVLMDEDFHQGLVSSFQVVSNVF